MNADMSTAEMVAELRQRANHYEAHWLLAVADRLEALVDYLDRAQLDSIEARNPGIDMDAVRAERAQNPPKWVGA